MKILKTVTRLFQKIKQWFKRKGYNDLVPESQALVHIAVHLVQAVKTITIDTVLDDVVADLLCKLLPSQAATIRKFKLQLEQNIPKWLLQLKIADAVLDAWKNRTTEGVEEVEGVDTATATTAAATTAAEQESQLLLAVIKNLNVSHERSQAYAELATRCLYYLNGGSDGKFDWHDCKDLVEEYYTDYVKDKTS